MILGMPELEDTTSSKAQKPSLSAIACADIIALAAHDAVALSNGPFYQVPTGRRDGRSSEALMASEMPEVGETVSSFKKKFAERSLSPKDLVVLSAAHTIGSTTCFFMTQRLHNFSSFGSDPTLDPALLPVLMDKCPKDGNVNERLGIDYGSEERFDTHILSNIRMGFVVLESDAKLYTDPETKFVLDSYFETSTFAPAPSFAKDIASAMLKMGNIGAGKQGEIRRVCNAVNS